MISKFSVFADESKHIHNNEALTMTSLRGSSIRVLAKPTGGVKCGDAEHRRACLCRKCRYTGLFESGNFQRESS
jgi:hypothetical protein